jgi:hypothetical protein
MPSWAPSQIRTRELRPAFQQCALGISAFALEGFYGAWPLTLRAGAEQLSRRRIHSTHTHPSKPDAVGGQTFKVRGLVYRSYVSGNPIPAQA